MDLMFYLTAGLYLVMIGVVFGVNKKSVSVIDKSHTNLKNSFIAHKDDSTIHIDPVRDPKAMEELKDNINHNFELLHLAIEKLDKRCEKRGTTCANHFQKLSNKIAAETGKANGDDDEVFSV